MLLPKPIKKFIAVFRGKISPFLILFSVLLGFWFGISPGVSGIQLAIFLIVLILNVNMGLFIIFAAIGKALTFAGAPVLYHLGIIVHDYLPFIITILSHIPVFAMSAYSRISLAGAVIAGPVIGFVFGYLLMVLVLKFRKKWFDLYDNSEKFQKWYSKKWVRILDRILIGKSASDPKEVLQGKGPIIRKPGIAVAAVIILIMLTVSFLIPDETITNYARKSLTKANGAEVDIENLDLNPISGKISASNLQVTDSQKPTHNKIQVENITADAGLTGMLMGKIVIDDITLLNVHFDKKRDTPGEVIEKPEQEKPTVPDVDAEKIDKYVSNAKKIREWLKRIKKYLPESKTKTPNEPEKIPQSYLEYLTARLKRPPSPRLIIKRLQLDNIDIPVEFLGKSDVTATNISDAPAQAAMPVGIKLLSSETDGKVDLSYDFSVKEDQPNLKGEFSNIMLNKVGSVSGLKFDKGTSSGDFAGTMTSVYTDLLININVKDMQLSSDSKGMFGLDSETTKEVFDSLKDFKLAVRVVGPTDQPGINVDASQLQESIKEALVKAGKEKLLKKVDEQLEGKVGSELKDKLGETGDQVMEGIKGLFNK